MSLRGRSGGEKSEKLSLEKRKKGGQDGEKKNKVKGANCFFLLLIGPVGHAGGYHSEISHLTLWYCSDQMSSG